MPFCPETFATTPESPTTHGIPTMMSPLIITFLQGVLVADICTGVPAVVTVLVPLTMVPAPLELTFRLPDESRFALVGLPFESKKLLPELPVMALIPSFMEPTAL